LLKESRDLAKEWGVTTVFKNKRRKITKRFEVLQPDKHLSFSNEMIKKEAGKRTSKYNKDMSVDLCEQLIVLKTCLKSVIEKIHSIKELTDLLLIKFNSLSSSFLEVITACCLFLTLPTATAERSCSKLKLIKNYLRTSMGQERLSVLSILSIETEHLEKLKSCSAMDV
jgi:hypothetical protein